MWQMPQETLEGYSVDGVKQDKARAQAEAHSKAAEAVRA
jgi:hypothetical protein